jgi:hypothetical protein
VSLNGSGNFSPFYTRLTSRAVFYLGKERSGLTGLIGLIGLVIVRAVAV